MSSRSFFILITDISVLEEGEEDDHGGEGGKDPCHLLREGAEFEEVEDHGDVKDVAQEGKDFGGVPALEFSDSLFEG